MEGEQMKVGFTPLPNADLNAGLMPGGDVFQWLLGMKSSGGALAPPHVQVETQSGKAGLYEIARLIKGGQARVG